MEWSGKKNGCVITGTTFLVSSGTLQFLFEQIIEEICYQTTDDIKDYTFHKPIVWLRYICVGAASPQFAPENHYQEW